MAVAHSSTESLQNLTTPTTPREHVTVAQTLVELLEKLPLACIPPDTDLPAVQDYLAGAREESDKLQAMGAWTENAEATYDQFILIVAETLRFLGMHGESEKVWSLSPAWA